MGKLDGSDSKITILDGELKGSDGGDAHRNVPWVVWMIFSSLGPGSYYKTNIHLSI
jgi:hypothetical protein